MSAHSFDTTMSGQSIDHCPFMSVFGAPAVMFERGLGTELWDSRGKRYLDFLSGIAVVSLGHCNEAVGRAVSEQMSTLVHVSNFFTNPVATRAAIAIDELLAGATGSSGQVFMCNSGAEANEAAIKLARKFGGRGRHVVVSALGSFHGRTLAALAATGQPAKHEPFQPMPEGFRHVPFNDLEAMREAITPKVAAIMLEPVLGEGGIHPATVEYLQGVRKLCDEHGILLILDEVQSGIGRMGYLYGYEAYGIEPDVITLAKGLGGGLPIAACLAKEHAAVFTPGDHGSTYSGSPLVCAAALAGVKAILETDLLANVRAMTDHLHAGLKSLQAEGDVGISEIRVSGLWMGIEFDEDRAGAILDKCRNDGLLVNRTSANTIRIAPPLIVTRDDCDRFLDIFGRACAR